MVYESGIALKKATKQVKSAMTHKERNPPGTDPSMFKCRYYHPSFCTALGHKDARSPNCYANGMDPDKRDQIAKAIVSELAAKTSEKPKELGK